MLKFGIAYSLLVILLSKEITGRPQFGFDIFGGYDYESNDDKDTNLMEPNGKIFSDWLSSIFDYFYDDSDDGDDKFLICKNCTVIVGESPTTTQAASSTTQAVTTNGQSSTQGSTTVPDNGQSSRTTQRTDSTDGSTAASGQ